MADITAAQVKALREITDLPMMDCKKALTEAGGDQEKAIAILRENFKKVQLKRAENATEEGRVFTLTSDDGSQAAMVEIQCESAPVASGDALAAFGEAFGFLTVTTGECRNAGSRSQDFQKASSIHCHRVIPPDRSALSWPCESRPSGRLRLLRTRRARGGRGFR